MVVPTGAEAGWSDLVGGAEVGRVGTGEPPPRRRRRRGWVVVFVHVAAEAEGVFGIVVGLLVFIPQRFVPEIVQVIWERRVLGG